MAAPGSALSTTPLWQPGVPVAEAGSRCRRAPMINGTSVARAVGGRQALPSAAKATDRGVTLAALRRALYSSATWIDGVGVRPGQRPGQRAKRGPCCRGTSPPGPTRWMRRCARRCRTSWPPRTAAPASTTGACLGLGEHRRSRSPSVTITRNTGPAGNLNHQLRWIGNDGNASARSSPWCRRHCRSRWWSGPSRARARMAPCHGSTTRRPRPSTPRRWRRWSPAPRRPPAYAFSRQSASAAASTSPTSSPCRRARGRVRSTSRQPPVADQFIAINPWAIPVETGEGTACYTNFSDEAACNPLPAYENPLPGVWEIEVSRGAPRRR